MKYTCLFFYVLSLILIAVNGEKTSKTIPNVTKRTTTSSRLPPKYYPSSTSVIPVPTVISDPTSIDDLPISDVAKKYCSGKNVFIRFDTQNFICEMFDYYNTSGCAHVMIGHQVFTSFVDECYGGYEIEEGIYTVTSEHHNDKCTRKYNHMLSYRFGPESDLLRVWKREINNLYSIDYKPAQTIDDLPVNDLAKKNCKGHRNNYLFFNDTDFLCYLDDTIPSDGCRAPIYGPQFAISTFNNECLNGTLINDNLYNIERKSLEYCISSGNVDVENMNAYYIKNDMEKAITTTSTTSKTLPISKSTTTTKTLPITKSTTTTKTLPITKSTTTTKTLPITKSTTTTKTLPITKSTTTTKTLPITKSTTTTKTLPITKSTTTTKTLPITKSTTTTKTLPITKSTTTTKTLPITKTITETLPTKCIPVTVTITEKETSTTTIKETVYVTITAGKEDGCVKLFGQCGGIGYNGPTCCQSGSTCKVMSPYYSQCVQY